MKRKVQLFLVALATGVVLAPTVQAQTDITDQYLVNPSFEFEAEGVLASADPLRGDPWGWTREGVLVGNSWGTNFDAYGYFTDKVDRICWYNSSPMPDNLEVFQIVKGLPAGDYLVTCKLGIFPDRISNQRLFANNNVQHFMSEERSANMLEEGEARTFAGYIPEVKSEGGANRAVLQGMLVMTTIKAGDDLKIGIRATNKMESGERNYSTNYGWFKMDDFKLYYLEDGISGYYKLKLEQLVNRVNNIDATATPKGDYNAILISKEEAQDLINNSDDPELIAAKVASLEADLTNIDLAQKAWIKLIEMANSEFDALKELEYTGLPAFQDAFYDVVELIESEETTRVAIEAAVLAFETAIRDYKFSGFSSGTQEKPFDATWYLVNPCFNPKDPASFVDHGTVVEGWNFDQFWWMKTGDLYNFNLYFAEKWVNGSDGLFLPNSGVYQTITNIPNGLYRISASMVACNQGKGSDFMVEGAYLSGNSTTKQVSTQQSENANAAQRYDLDVVVTDGTLTFGMKVDNTTASWVGIDSVTLVYYGKDLASYETAYTQQIAKATALKNADILPKDLKALQDVIAASEAADRSTIAALEVVLANLDQVIEDTELGLNNLKTFKSGSYNKALLIAENAELLYPANVVDLITNVIVEMNGVLDSDTTTIAVYPALATTLDNYISFINAYQSLDEYKLTLYEDALISLIGNVLTTQIEVVALEESKIEDSKTIFTSIKALSQTYMLAMACVNDGRYPEDALIALFALADAEIEATEADFQHALIGEQKIREELGAMRFHGFTAGENTEVTSVVVVNPTIDTFVTDVAPDGWTVSKGGGNDFTNKSAHWSGDLENTYLNSYHGTQSALKYTAKQEIIGIPNGTYKLVAAGRSHGDGAYVYAISGGEIFKAEIPNKGDRGGNIWSDSEGVDPVLYEVHDGTGFGWNWVEVADINVNNNSMVIGCSTDATVTQGTPFNGWWFSVDDFKLYYVSTDYISGVETATADEAEALVAYVENGYIVVPNVEEYTITTLEGILVSPFTQLTSGVYIVKSGSKSVKVFVE